MPRAHIGNREERKKHWRNSREQGRGTRVLQTLGWRGLPLSITIPKHGFSQLSGLSFQLLHLLQQRFFAGVLGPVSQGKDNKNMTHELYTAVKTGRSSFGPHLDALWLTEAEAWGSWSIRGPCAWQGLHLHNLGSIPSAAEHQKSPSSTPQLC